MRIGQSTDIHPLVPGRKLVLGGVEIPFEKGTLGHSDGDALLHAITESIIGAMGLGDIGKHFPDTDPATEGISSVILLEKTAALMRKNGYRVGNIDSLILIERPKMRPYIDAMRENIAKALDCDLSRINVKATRGEKMGPVGHGECVVAQAVCLLEETEAGDGKTE